MRISKFSLLLLSALLYPLGFLEPTYFWWSSLIFLIPLLHTALFYTLSFTEGFLWSLISLAIHSSGILYSIFAMANIRPWYLLPLFLLMVCSVALYGGLWFLIGSLIKAKLRLGKPWLILSLWATLIFLYFIVIDQYCLWPFNRVEGYALANPLLPLTQYAPMLSCIAVLGKTGLLGLLFIFQVVITLFLYKPKCSYALIITVCFMPLVIGVLASRNKINLPGWLSSIAILPEAFYNPDLVQKTATEVTQKLQEILTKNPAVSVIIMPESSLFLCDLHAHPELAQAWSEKYLQKKITIIAGGIYAHNNSYYNTAYIITNGIIAQWFCKRHAMLITERFSSLSKYLGLHKFYYTKRPYITPSEQPRPVIRVNSSIALVPYICSELFFNEHPDDIYKSTPIVALCNDSWILVPYVKKLMYLTAQFKSLQWQRPIIYVAYDHAYYFDRSIKIPLI